MSGPVEIHRLVGGRWIVTVDGRATATASTLAGALAQVAPPVFATGPVPGTWQVHDGADEPPGGAPPSPATRPVTPQAPLSGRAPGDGDESPGPA